MPRMLGRNYGLVLETSASLEFGPGVTVRIGIPIIPCTYALLAVFDSDDKEILGGIKVLPRELIILMEAALAALKEVNKRES